MTKLLKKSLALVLACTLCIIAVPTKSQAYTAPVSTTKIGLYYGTNTLFGANLENANNKGSGYQFGYYDSNREFVPTGAYTYETKISMVVDRNVYFSTSNGNYHEWTSGTSANVIVGCFHIKLDTAYNTFDEARAAADTFTSVNAFPIYSSGIFYVCVGDYTSRADAEAAAASLTINQGYSIYSGTSNTVTVVQTTSGKVLFEFDYGTSYNLAVLPLAGSDGVKPMTWFKGYCYYGGFQYTRLTGGAMTVVNVVDVEDYIKGVIPYEMSASWPLEALKAQSVCARTYLMSNINKHKSYGFDLCNTDDCQVYHGGNKATAASDSAVDATAGEYLTYEDQLCQTYYYSSNGGASESSGNVWTNQLGYLVGKYDPYEADIANTAPSYSWTVSYDNSSLKTRLNSRNYNCSTVVKMEILEVSNVGNVIKIRITDDRGVTFTITGGDKIRRALGTNSIRFGLVGAATAASTEVYVNDDGGKISSFDGSYAIGSSGAYQIASGDVYAITASGTEKLGVTNNAPSVMVASGSYVMKGTGWGHNVGMSQWGAYSMAKYHSKSYKDILTFYYDGTQVVHS